MNDLDIFMRASAVKRYHTTPTIGNQTIGEHSYRMLLVLYAVCTPSPELIKATVYHDVPEIEVSDVSFMTKKKWPKVAESIAEAEDDFCNRYAIHVELCENDLRLLKFADMWELVQYAIDQINLGNRNMIAIGERGVQFLKDMPFISSACDKLITYIEKELNRVRF